ncbi:MAG: preprotein translocase subunit SecG [Clostridia bacterium]|nr:preprotein translocase subunit SecG [Clostridia bacterium]
MSPLQIILGIILLVAAIFLIVVVMLQDKAKRGLSGAIAGGSNENTLSKNSAPQKGKWLSKLTTIVAIVFVAVVVIAYLFT